MQSIFQFNTNEVIYKPYPVIYLQNFIDSHLYQNLIKNWPNINLFKEKPGLGNKYSLSERNNKHNYLDFINHNKYYLDLHKYIKSPLFVESTLEFLKFKNIDIALSNPKIVSKQSKNHSSWISRIKKETEISARFEFSMMHSHAGNILPHTDDPNKIITMVISMNSNDEWSKKWGGGTQICEPKDERKIFNQKNSYLKFSDVKILKEFPYQENQCILFIKTYNSWHQVSPLKGPAKGPFRKTLTINIEVIK